jgi:hypothetical protein
MKRFTALAAIGLALVVPSAALSIRSANSTSFVDPTSDSATAPDISSVTVSNDDQGVVTFSIGFAELTQLGPTDFVRVYADIDRAWSTGDHGFDVAMHVEGSDTALFAYDGSSWNEGDASSLHSSYAGGVLTISIGLFDLAAIGDFDFFVYSSADRAVRGDYAPDACTPCYDYATKVPLLFERLTAPSSVKAGKTLLGSMIVVTDSDTQGVVTCTAKVGSARLRGEPGWLNISVFAPRDANGGPSPQIGHKGYARCSFKVPKNAKGKVISATITAKRSGAVVSRTFATRIG